MAEIIRAFAERRRKQRRLAALVLAVVVAMALTQDRAAGTVFGVSTAVGGPIVLAVVVGAILYSRRNWRCPACARFLGRTFSPRRCPGCGAALQP